MIVSFFKRVSTIIMVLILFCSELISLPLSRTCFTVPADSLDFYFGEEIISDSDLHRVDVAVFNLGLTDATSFGVEWNYLNYDINGNESKAGDTLLELWHYTGRYLYNTLDSGISLRVRIPTGPEPGIDETWRNLSVGRSEVRITPVLSFLLSENEILNLNISYILREGRGESFYGALKGNLKDADTYRSVFGLNPFFKDSFLSSDRLSDDYISSAVSFIENRFYPLVFFCEIYYAFTDFQKDREVTVKTVEGEGEGLVMASAGCKYFIRSTLFCIIYGTLSPLSSGEEESWSSGAGINIFF